jgi:hypothetical protein
VIGLAGHGSRAQIGLRVGRIQCRRRCDEPSGVGGYTVAESWRLEFARDTADVGPVVASKH